MKTLIAYATKYGAAENSAGILADKLDGEVDLLNLKKKDNINFGDYEKIIIGSSVYMGKIRKEASQFCTDNQEKLKNKKIGLYACCMREGEEGVQQLKDNFPSELINNAVVADVFGGEFNFEKMNFLEKMVVKKVAGVKQTTSNLLRDKINNFARLMNEV